MRSKELRKQKKYSDEYIEFLIKHATQSEPHFNAVVSATEIQTDDGPMYELSLNNEIENPNTEIIATSIVNNNTILLWRHKYWMLAVDNNKEYWHVTNRNVLLSCNGQIIIYEVADEVTN